MARRILASLRSGWDELNAVWPFPVPQDTKAKFRHILAITVAALLVGSAAAFLVPSALVRQWGVTTDILLGLASLGSLILGVLVFRYGIVLPALWLRSGIRSARETQRDADRSSQESETGTGAADDDSGEHPLRHPFAPEHLQPNPALIVRAGANLLPLTLRPRASLRYWLAWEASMTTLFVALSLPLVICAGGAQMLTLSNLAFLVALFAGVSLFSVLPMILLRDAPINSTIIATEDGLTVADIPSAAASASAESAKWEEIHAWIVWLSAPDELLFGARRTYSVWGWDEETQEETLLLVWDEYDLMPLAGREGWFRGRQAYRDRSNLLHALIAAKTGLALRAWSQGPDK